ncbi:MAG: hypothetical protein ACI4SO_07515 [Muribaculaceae bacterium]
MKIKTKHPLLWGCRDSHINGGATIAIAIVIRLAYLERHLKYRYATIVERAQKVIPHRKAIPASCAGIAQAAER